MESSVEDDDPNVIVLRHGSNEVFSIRSHRNKCERSTFRRYVFSLDRTDVDGRTDWAEVDGRNRDGRHGHGQTWTDSTDGTNVDEREGRDGRGREFPWLSSRYSSSLKCAARLWILSNNGTLLMSWIRCSNKSLKCGKDYDVDTPIY